MAAPPDLKGKTCVLTGASSGIGRATAIELARAGARMILICRDRARGEAIADELARSTTNQGVELMLADLSSQAEIRGVAGDLLAKTGPIHLLINNAGVVNLRRELSVDGIEMVFAVNHLAYFLLTNLLLPRLRESAPARIVNVASDAHRFTAMNFDDLGGERSYRSLRIYGQSKLANILFTYELARRLRGSGVTANCLHPGGVATGLGKNNGWWARVLTRALSPFIRTPERGAETSIHLATSPEVEGVSGKYFVNREDSPSSKASYDRATAERLWQLSESLTTPR